MPAINIPMYVPVREDSVPKFSNSASIANMVNASTTPIGNVQPNPLATYYVQIDHTSDFVILVPKGYVLAEMYELNDDSERWQTMTADEVKAGTGYTNKMCYNTDGIDAGDAGTAYWFCEHDWDGDPNVRTFQMSFNIR